MRRIAVVILSAAAAVFAAGEGRADAAEPGLPLPDAPVRLLIPDPAAFDAALSGSFRAMAAGQLRSDDPLLSAWRQSPVGSKLEAEWTKLAADLPWTWTDITRLQPRTVGMALFSAGNLEAVLVVDTRLAVLPFAPPAGRTKSHAGVPYWLVTAGAGDAQGSDQRRMGLAWARHHSLLLVATSERGLTLTIDEIVAGRGVSPFLPGLASLELDLDRLRQDRYFAREFRFGTAPGTGRLRAALRLEAGHVVEVREGHGPRSAPAFLFDANAAAAGWEPEADGLARALRAGLLEPIPTLLDRPVPPLAPLPTTAAQVSDPYLVHLDRPLVLAGASWEEGDLAGWREITERRPSAGWGWRLAADGGRAIVFSWPEARQAEIEGACRDTLRRRAGRVEETHPGDAVEWRVGPGLATLALRRTGDFVWVGTDARTVASLAAPRPAADVVRWARLDLRAARAHADRWARAEGPAAPERVRPFSDRVLGLLGWMPSVQTITVERRQDDTSWTERVAFEVR